MTTTAPRPSTAALSPSTPSNAVLLEQAFQTEAAEAHWDRAVPLARELVAKSAENRMAYLAARHQ